MKSTSLFNADRFILRTLQDAMTQAEAATWHRRANMFEAAMPRPGDYLGKSTDEEQFERTQRLATAAQACRNRAALCETTEHEEQLIVDTIAAAAQTMRDQRQADRARRFQQGRETAA